MLISRQNNIILHKNVYVLRGNTINNLLITNLPPVPFVFGDFMKKSVQNWIGDDIS